MLEDYFEEEEEQQQQQPQASTEVAITKQWPAKSSTHLPSVFFLWPKKGHSV
jgi:hypothetical protein